MYHDPSDLESLILTRIIQKERPHKLSRNSAIDTYLRENRELEKDTPTCVDTNYFSRTIPRDL